MTRLSAKDALLGGKPNKYRNKPVWECQSCGMTWHWAPGSKHCAPRCGQNTIIKFASTKEFNRWHELKKAEKAGRIRNLRRQVPFMFEVCTSEETGTWEYLMAGKRKLTYWADFVYEDAQQAMDDIINEARHHPSPEMLSEVLNECILPVVVEDAKGKATAVYRIKKELMDKINGIRIFET